MAYDKAYARKYYRKNKQALAAKARARREELSRFERVILDSNSNARRPGHEPIFATCEELEQALIRQSHKCKLCGKPDQPNHQYHKLRADHNHETGQFRGWICHSCNSMLGLVERVGLAKINNYLP